MSKPANTSNITRRQFLGKGGSIAAGATVMGRFRSGSVFAGEDNTIRLALIGCGGRGNGAAGDALSVAGKGPIKWQYEWNELIESIRKDRPHNEIRRAVYSDLTSLMGRAACHTGQEITWDQIMASNFQFCDYLNDLDFDSPAPVKADSDGQFPFPISGQWKEI